MRIIFDVKSSTNGFMETRVSDFTTLKTVFVQDMKFMDLFGQPGPGPAGKVNKRKTWALKSSLSGRGNRTEITGRALWNGLHGHALGPLSPTVP